MIANHACEFMISSAANNSSDSSHGRGRARPSRVPCASGAHVRPTIDAARASNGPAQPLIHGVRGSHVRYVVHIFQRHGEGHARHE